VGFQNLVWDSNAFVVGDKAGYAGVALYSKEKPLNVKMGIGNKEQDSEGRIITAEYDKFFLVTTYVPNAGWYQKSLLYGQAKKTDACGGRFPVFPPFF